MRHFEFYTFIHKFDLEQSFELRGGGGCALHKLVNSNGGLLRFSLMPQPIFKATTNFLVLSRFGLFSFSFSCRL